MTFLSNFFKGMAISISQLIPGVSGGTIAIILGLYEKILHAINNIFTDFKIQAKFLLQVFSGVIFGFFLFSNIIKILIESYPIPIGYLFVGVILGGAPIMFKNATKTGFEKKNILYFFLGLGLVLLTGGNYAGRTSLVIETLNWFNFTWLFVGGIIMAIALIFPGISGSFMLYVLGLYNTVITAATKFNIPILIPIVLGVILGTLLTSKIIERLLTEFPQQTYILILGFILGSVIPIFPGVDEIYSIIGLVLGIAGFGFTYFLTIFRKRIG